MSVYVKPPINQPPVAKGGLFSLVVIYHVLLKKIYLSTKKNSILFHTIETAKNFEVWWKLYQFSDRLEYFIRFLN